MASPCESCIRSSLSTCPRNECSPPETGCATRCEPPQAEVLRTSQRQRQTGAASPDPKAQDLESLSRGEGGGLWGGGGLCEGASGGASPPADFSIPAGGFSGGFFWRIFPVYFATKKIHRKIHRSVESSCFRNPPALRHQKFTGLPPPPRGEQIQLLCVRVWDRRFSGWEFPGKDSRFN